MRPATRVGRTALFYGGGVKQLSLREWFATAVLRVKITTKEGT